MNNWNPQVEHIEGKLCEKGLLHEHYDIDRDELVRTMTPLGKNVALDLLKDPEYRRAYLRMAKNLFSKFPPEQRKILWQRLVNQLKNIK